MQANPLVTVVVTSYNHRDFIEQTIDSVCAQTYSPVQLLVVDDCSTDNSQQLIRELAATRGFDYILNEKNGGLNPALVKALQEARGEFVSLVASDDFFTPQKIEEQVSYLLQNGYDGVYANGYSYENGVEKLIKLDRVFNQYDQHAALQLFYRQDWGGPLIQSGLFKKTLLLDLIEIRQQFKSDDWAFAIKAFEKYKMGFINKPLFYYRIHGSNTHKKYWYTFPMRIDIASRLVPEEYRMETLSNLFLSQGQYLAWDKRRGSIRFFLCSLILHFSFQSVKTILISMAVSVKQFFATAKNKS